LGGTHISLRAFRRSHLPHSGVSTWNSPHRIGCPLSWLLEAASRRSCIEPMPKSYRGGAGSGAARGTAASGARVQAGLAIARKQKASGLWGGNLLAPAASKAYGWTEPGTVYQVHPPGACSSWGGLRRSGCSGTPTGFCFQLLSRIETDDPDRAVAQRALELLVGSRRKADPGLGRWARTHGAGRSGLRPGATARSGSSVLDPRQQLKQKPVGVPETPAPTEATQLEQAPVLVNRTRLGPAVRLWTQRAPTGFRPTARTPFACERSPGPACTRAPLAAVPRAAPDPAPPRVRLRHRLDTRSAARRLEQPRQRQPMRCGSSRCSLRSAGGATAEGAQTYVGASNRPGAPTFGSPECSQRIYLQ